MNVYHLTDAEHSKGCIDPNKLDDIRADFHESGFAVVAGIVPSHICEALHGAMLEDVIAVRAKDKLTFHEKATGAGHLQLGPRRYAPFAYPELIANPILECVVSGILGPGAWLGFYNGNVNCPDSSQQPLHFDRPFSWTTEAEATAAGQSWPPPSTTVSCSVALSEITEATGATEIYPGTHLETAVLDFDKGEQPAQHPELVAKWAPPGRMEIPAGGVCFRDPRMWHRGISNPSDTPRPMLALTYHSQLAKHQRGTLVELSEADLEKISQDPSLKVLDDGSIGDGRLYFHESAEKQLSDALNMHGIERNLRFVPETVNHFLDAHLLGGARVTEQSRITPYPKD